MSNGEVDGESLLFLSSGPPVAKAWEENLGAKGEDWVTEGPFLDQSWGEGGWTWVWRGSSWTAVCEHGMSNSGSHELFFF